MNAPWPFKVLVKKERKRANIAKDHERCQEMVGLCVFRVFFAITTIHGCWWYTEFSDKKGPKAVVDEAHLFLEQYKHSYIFIKWKLIDFYLTWGWHVVDMLVYFFMYLAYSALLHHTKAGSEWIKFWSIRVVFYFPLTYQPCNNIGESSSRTSSTVSHVFEQFSSPRGEGGTLAKKC